MDNDNNINGVFLTMNKDKVGMFLSGICGVHCMLMPFLLVILPYSTVAYLNNEIFETSFIVFSLTLASFAMIQGYMAHRKLWPILLAGLGFAIFFNTHIHGSTDHVSILLGLAGGCVCVAHYLNHRFSHICECEK